MFDNLKDIKVASFDGSTVTVTVSHANGQGTAETYKLSVPEKATVDLDPAAIKDIVMTIAKRVYDKLDKGAVAAQTVVTKADMEAKFKA